MPTLTEKHESRNISYDARGSAITRKYFVDTGDPEEASDLIPDRGTPHPDKPTFVVDSVSVEPDPEAYDRCVMEITYRTFPNNVAIWIGAGGGAIPYREIWEYDAAGQQEHITSVVDASLADHFPASSAAEVGTAIGKHGDEIEGVDVFRPVVTLRVSQIQVFLSAADAADLGTMVGTVNGGPWLGFLTGEVLCTGVNVTTNEDGFAEIKYTFLVSYKQPAFSITIEGVGSTSVDLAPWDYFWVVHGEKEGGGSVQHLIKSAHIARVYPSANFDFFGLLGP